MPADAATYLLPTITREVGSGADPATLKRLTGAVVAWVERNVGLSLSGSAERVIYLDGGSGGTEALWLPQSGTVSKVEVRSGGSSFDEEPSADYALESTRLIRSDGGRWPKGYANIRVTTTSGPSKESEWPQDLLQVVVDLVGMLYRTRRTSRPTALPDDDEMRASMSPWHWRVLKDNRPSRIA